jgi:hypothetical protein
MGISVTKDIEVVKKQFHENAQLFLKGHTYWSLVNGWGILQTNKSPLIGNEYHFVPILRNYHKIMVAWKVIQEKIHFMTYNQVEDLFGERQGVWILLCDNI